MPIQVTCQCGKQYNLNDELAGKRAKCPACGGIIPVPRPQAGQASGALPQPPPPVAPSRTGGKVRYQCPGCGTALENPAALVGQSDTCPSCKLKHIVPDSPAPLPTPSKLANLFSSPKKILITAGIIGGAVLATIILVYALRPPAKAQAGQFGPALLVQWEDSSSIFAGDPEHVRLAQEDGPELSPETVRWVVSSTIDFVDGRPRDTDPQLIGMAWFDRSKINRPRRLLVGWRSLTIDQSLTSEEVDAALGTGFPRDEALRIAAALRARQ